VIKRKKLLWRIYASYLFLILLAMIAISWYTYSTFVGAPSKNLSHNLQDQATLFGRMSQDNLEDRQWDKVQTLSKEMGLRIGSRITMIMPNGLVIADSEKQPLTMDNHGMRPEVLVALRGQNGESIRYSRTLNNEMMYVAVPIVSKDEVVAVVRTAMPVPIITKSLRKIVGEIALGSFVVALFAAVLALVVAHRINRPLQVMQQGAERFAQGDLEYRLQVPDLDEPAALADAMNQMANKLNERFHIITRQKNELEAVLSAMMEAVMVVDEKGAIVRFNKAAGKLFGVNPDEVEGKRLLDVVENQDLDQIIHEMYETRRPMEGEMVYINGGETFLQVHGTFIEGAPGMHYGAQIVLNDVTKLKKLERIRKDFVTNVSHELKTPITSIKGFVETLSDGAMEDPEASKKFLGIILNHADRINAIIDDLLALSRIEQDEDKGEITLEAGSMCAVLRSAVVLCKQKAQDKGVKLELICKRDPAVQMSGALLEQAVINLIDNAIKYSDPDTTIKVILAEEEKNAVICVADQGWGITPKHLPRIFERFYRVDKSRSRKMGGTGLGLAIVKHIINAHDGKIVVESEVLRGSQFSIYLPKVGSFSENQDTSEKG